MDDIRGRLSVTTQADENGQVPRSDQVSIQSFGFAYDAHGNRAVAVFLCYLHKLTARHQRMWETKLLDGTYRLHPDYYRNALLGQFGTKHSILSALLEEMRVINDMCSTLGRPPLFLEDFRLGLNLLDSISFSGRRARS